MILYIYTVCSSVYTLNKLRDENHKKMLKDIAEYIRKYSFEADLLKEKQRREPYLHFNLTNDYVSDDLSNQLLTISAGALYFL